MNSVISKQLLLLCAAAEVVNQQDQDIQTKIQKQVTSVKKWQLQIIDEIKPSVKLEETDKGKTESSIDVTALPNCMNGAFKDSLKRSKDHNAVKKDEYVPQAGSNRIKSILQQSALLDSNFETNKSTDSPSDMNAVVLRQLNHDYAKNIDVDQLSNASLVETEKYENKRRKVDNTSNKFDLNSYWNGKMHFVPPKIPIPGFPFVYTPCPLEPAQIVELHSNGEPVNLMKHINLQPPTSRIPSKKSVKKKKARLVNKKRPVLESVENCVDYSSNISSEPTDHALQNDAIENHENFNSICTPEASIPVFQ
ncbi:hypothetical protein HNY73_016244 [Argiope bruennichi]|uniref:Uncharacterized protein n=1 Tax=Argiope bruennichi TaxID=94029 RepID=A0A8T0EI69_ARGBR|nr:hypothetical protein HNY73_016244 [Argiope bruennichi]